MIKRAIFIGGCARSGTPCPGPVSFHHNTVSSTARGAKLWAALGLPPMWTIAAISLVATVIGYRPAKAIWFALLYEWGFMARGDAPPPGSSPRTGR